MLAGFVLVSADQGEGRGYAAGDRQALRTGPPDGVTVLLIVDSMGEDQGSDPELMPNLVALADRRLSGKQHTCFANFTLPCLITTFEGRASPFLTALNNFSAEALGNPNWLDSLRDAGYRIAVLSDHTLTKLYPDTFVDGISYEQRKLPNHERDAWAIEQTRKWLTEGRHDVVITHFVYTDKVTHAHHPGHPEYKRAFKRVDDYIGELSRTMDLSRDTLIVFGDHGHGEGGHHHRRSWYVAAGPKLARGQEAIEQTSLLFLFSWLHELPLPPEYEGELEWNLLGATPQAEARWRRVIAEGWGLDPERSSREDLEAELARRAELRAGRPYDQLIAFLPWWIHLILIGGALTSHFLGREPIAKAWGTYQLVWVGLAVYLDGGWVVWLALVLQAWLSWPRGRGWLGFGSIAGWSAAGLASGLMIPWIFATFHIKSGFSWVAIAWYVLFIGVPFALGAWSRPRDGSSRWARGAIMVLAAGALLAAPGIYYYSAAQMISLTLVPAGFLAILVTARLRGLWRLSVLAAFLVGALFISVQAGGWDWRYRIQITLATFPAWAQMAMGALALGLAAVIWARTSWRGAAVGFGLLTLSGWPMVTFFEFETWRVAAIGLLTLSVTGGLRLLEDSGRGERRAIKTAWQVALILGACFIALMSAGDGFMLKNLRFEFALRRFQGDFVEEAELARFVALLVMLKYFLVLLPVILATGLTLGGRRLAEIAPWVVLVGTVKVLMMAMQTLGVAFVQLEKQTELLIMESIALTFIVLSLWISLATTALYRHAAQWILGRDRVADAPPVRVSSLR